MSDPRRLPATWLVGRRVRLRPIEPQDVPLLRRWHTGGTALAWLDRPMPLPSDAVADWAARASIDPEMPAFILQTRGGRDIGTGGLRLHGARAVLGVGITDARHWASGYAQDAVEVLADGAFRIMPLQRIELTAFPEDRRALACYRKAGFRKEGVLRQYAYEQGRYRDCVLLSVLHAEWVRRRTSSAG